MTFDASMRSNQRKIETRSWFDIEKAPHFKRGVADFGTPFCAAFDAWPREQQSYYELGRQFAACGGDVETTGLQWRGMHRQVTP
jgi:hypothetical protein